MKLYLCALLLAGSSIKTIAQSDVATAKWKPSVTVDGRLTEWQQPLSFYDGDTKLFFDIANDSSTLYLCFKSEDEMTQMKLMRAGMKITLSTKGKPKHEASITYPLPPGHSSAHQGGDNSAAAAEPADAPGRSIHDAASFRENFTEHHPLMNTAGFATANGEIATRSASGLTVVMNWDSTSSLIYEIAIPKKEFFGSNYSAKEAAADINLSVEINALHTMSGDDSKNSAHPGGGMHGGGMREGGVGSYHGGRENGGERQESDANRVQLGTKTSFKQKFVLGGAAQ